MKIFDSIELKLRNNKLKLENDCIKKQISDKLYEDFVNKFEKEEQLAKLKQENKELRVTIKKLKNELKILDKKGGKNNGR